MNLKLIFLALFGLLLGALGLGTVDSVYVDIGSLVIAIPLFSEYVIDTFKLKKFLAQLMTWGIGVVLTFIGWIFSLGFLAASPQGDPYLWYEVLAIGIAVSLIANGIWPVIIKQILEKAKLIDG